MDDYLQGWQDDDSENEGTVLGIRFHRYRPEKLPSRKRKSGSKEKAMLGIWASDDEEEENPKTKLLSNEAPQFVKGETLKEESEEEAEEKPQFSQTTPGFARSSQNLESTKLEEEDDEDADARPSFGAPKFSNYNNNNNTGKDGKKEKEDSFSKPRFGQAKRNTLASRPEFEKHTKGIGSKLLEKMGWQPGQGLGAQKQGINRPIEVKVRPKNRGLGYEFDERTQQQKEDFPTEGDMEEKLRKGESDVTEMEIAPEEPGWKKTSNRKPKKRYDAPKAATAVTPIKIMDMTGESPRVLGSMQELYTNNKPVNADFEPELQHNIRLFVDLKEVDILNVEKQTQKDQEQLDKLQQTKVTLEQTVSAEEKRLNKIQEVTQIIGSCYDKVKARTMELPELAKIFVLFQKQYTAEYQEYKLHYLASAMVLPLLREKLDSWDPLSEPTVGFAEFKIWHDLIAPKEEPDYMDEDSKTKELDVYTQMIVDIILPKIRNALTNKWNVKDPEQCLKLLETWQPILTDLVLQNILEQLVLPKLYSTLETWNPKLDTVRVDQWLLPWLSFMGERLEPLYAPIRHKISIALQEWTPSDGSAHLVLEPWKNVFEYHAMQSLLDRSIMPKLVQLLQNFEVNPAKQKIEPVDWVMVWDDLIPIHKLAALFETLFFPKWHQALYTWLSSSNPNYEEIQRWYRGWRQKFEPNYVQQENIKSQFVHALTVLNSKISGGAVPPPPTPPKAAFQTPLSSPVAQTQLTKPSPSTPKSQDIGFKEMVSRYAESKGEYLLTTDKLFEGKTIYSIGKHKIVLEKDVVYKIRRGKAEPVDLDQLFTENANKSVGDVD